MKYAADDTTYERLEQIFALSKDESTTSGAVTAEKAEPVRVEMHSTRNSKPKLAVVHLSSFERQRAIGTLPALRLLSSYDESPAANEAGAATLIAKHLPEAVRVVELLHKSGFPSIVVKGMPAPCQNAVTPADGIVDEAAVKPNIGFLSGLFAAACELGAFTYASENGGRILRAVAPVCTQIGKASSQGFDSDLLMHNDNANQPMACEQSFVRGKPFMNPLQGFVAINTRDDVPMEVASLDDILYDLEVAHGHDAIAPLFAPEFAVCWPDSHARGGRIAVEHVPLLVRDSEGIVHSRFHSSNVAGLTSISRQALERFREQATTASVIEIVSDPGDLIVYSNTRMMHRRRAFAPRFDGTDRYYVRVYLAPLDILSCERVIA